MSYTLNKTGVQIDAILDRAETGGEIDQELALKAPLASPALTGTPTAPTPAEGDSSTKIATTEFVAAAVAGAITDTAGPADVVTIPDGSDAEMLSYKASIEPLQDLHGYSAPWPAGGGKNKVGKSEGNTGSITRNGVTFTFNADESITLSGTANANIYAYFYSSVGKTVNDTPAWDGYANATPFAAGQAIFSASVTGNTAINASNIVLGYYKSDETTTSVNGTSAAVNNIDRINSVYIYIPNGSNVNGAVIKYQLEYGGTATAWAPYSNICPISGWTGAEAVVTGANIWDEEWEEGSINGATGVPAPSAGYIRSKNFIPIPQGVSFYHYAQSGTVGYALYYADDETYLGASAQSITANAVFTPNVPAAKKMKLVFYQADYTQKRSINCPSTDTAYHAYNGTTYPIDWTDEAGTVYGGELNVTTGVLTVTKAYLDLGAQIYTKNNNFGGGVAFYFSIPAEMKTITDNSTPADIISENYAAKSSTYLFNNPTVDGMAQTVSGYVNIRDNGKSSMTADDFATAVSGVKFVYLLATPTTYQLTPTEVRTLLGANNCWTDTGETEIEYKADLKLYIDKKIAEAL